MSFSFLPALTIQNQRQIQAKKLGDILVVGVVADDQIRKHKGPPLLTLEERVTMIQSIKWVDEIIEGVPYDINREFMQILFDQHKIDYIVHGDDPCTLADGSDAYQFAKDVGKFKTFKRTDGVSTSDIVNRLLQIIDGNSLSTSTRSSESLEASILTLFEAPLQFSPQVATFSSSLGVFKTYLADLQKYQKSLLPNIVIFDYYRKTGSNQTRPQLNAARGSKLSASSEFKSFSNGSEFTIVNTSNQSSQQNEAQQKPSTKQRSSNQGQQKGPKHSIRNRSSSQETNNSTNSSYQNTLQQTPDDENSFFKFLPTSNKIVQFSNERGPQPGAKVVYVDGGFDLFHCGHVELFKEARTYGDYLLVGIYSNYDVKKRTRQDFPIMDLYERTLSVLACKYVDEVVIGAPTFISLELIRSFNISCVVRGDVSQSSKSERDVEERYTIPIKQGILRRYQSKQKMNLKLIMDRIQDNKQHHKKKSSDKVQKDLQVFKNRSSSMQEI